MNTLINVIVSWTTTHLSFECLVYTLQHRIAIGSDKHSGELRLLDGLFHLSQNGFLRREAEFIGDLAVLKSLTETLCGCEQMDAARLVNMFAYICLSTHQTSTFVVYM